MGEVVALTAAIGSILKAIGSTGLYLKSVSGASREVGDITKRVETTETVLLALRKTIEDFPQPAHFYDIWKKPANDVFGDLKTTIEELNSRLPLSGSTGKLSNLQRAKWQLAREETVLLLSHLQAEIQMLTVVQNALVLYVLGLHVPS